MSEIVNKNIGHATAYGYAKSKGYTGTEAEFAELMASYASVAQSAAASATAAAGSATSAASSASTASAAATTATTKASEASTSATNAAGSASSAASSATAASGSATSAAASATTASGKASEAATAATTATTAKTDAVAAKTAAETAQTAAETAQGKAETAQGAAEDAAESVSASAAQIATNTSDISDLKEELTSNNILHYDYAEYGEWVVGSYIQSNVSVGGTVNVEPITENNYDHKIISVSQGDLFIVQGRGGNGSRLWAFTDTEYKLISKTSYTSGQHTEYLTAPADGYLIANTYTGTSVVRSVQKYIATSPVYDSVTNKTDKGYYSLNNIVKDNNTGFIEIPSVGETVDYTAINDSDAVYGMFDCAEGDVFKISGSGGTLYRLWAFVDANDVVLSKSTANLSAVDLVLTVPANAVKFIYGGNFRNYNVEKLATNSKEMYLQAIYEAEYSQRNNGLDVLSAFNNVSCFGDSLTASVVYTGELEGGNHTTRSAYKKYPQILGDKIGAEYESVATGGYSASNWWSSYADRIIEKTNQLVVVYLGTNGGLTETVDTDAVGDDYSSYADTNTGNYCKIVKKALDVGARVLLVKIHQGGGTGGVQVTNRVIDAISERFNVAVVDVPFLDDWKYHAYPDGTGYNNLHYNDLGYAAFTDSLIKNVGFLSTSMMSRLIPQ